jgi:hypothetical protein
LIEKHNLLIAQKTAQFLCTYVPWFKENPAMYYVVLHYTQDSLRIITTILFTPAMYVWL